MLVLAWLGTPFLVATVLAFFLAKGWIRTYALFGLGLLIGFAVLLYAYLRAPTDYRHADCSDCEHVLGRWWEPGFLILFLGIAYFAWLVGVAVGLFFRVVLKRTS